MDKNLNKLTKKELLDIISKFKKESLISFILNKKGGENNKNIIRKTNDATRKLILFNTQKALEIENKAMANNSLYNTIYEEDDEEDN